MQNLTSVSNGFNVSPKYLVIDTSVIVEQFKSKGWLPVQVSYAKTRKAEKRGFQTHVVRLRNESVKTSEGYPEILLRNNHCGEKSFSISIGFFRLVCSNGLVVGTTYYSDSISHHNYNRQAIGTIIENAEMAAAKLIETIEKLNTTYINDVKLKELHDAALKLKVESNELVFCSDVNRFKNLEALRLADQEGTLWSYLNILQEKLVHGGLNYTVISTNENTGQAEFKIKRTRRITGLDNLLKSNQVLFNKALELVGAA
jgi:hypothetical protein